MRISREDDGQIILDFEGESVSSVKVETSGVTVKNVTVNYVRPCPSPSYSHFYIDGSGKWHTYYPNGK